MRKGKTQAQATYVALLRGVNVGGKNLIRMSALRDSFQRTGFQDVATYINSGNVLFKSDEGNARALESLVEKMLQDEHRLDCKVVVRSYAEVEELVKSLPESWCNDPDWRCNVIFLRHSIDYKEILDSLNPRPGIEEVLYRPGALLWRARVSDLTRSAMVKLPAHKVYQEMTIRNVNTTRRLFELMKKASES